jgi:hypothetical protein
MNKILILKNDRVGDLFHSLDGINAIIQQNKDSHIEIVLSNITNNFNFLFKINNFNVSVSYFNYRLNFFEKLQLLKKLLFNNYTKIYILSPKNFYFFLPLFFKSKYYAITVIYRGKFRPINFLKKKLYKFCDNNRNNKKKNSNINFLIKKLCIEKSGLIENSLNLNPSTSLIFKKNLSFINGFVLIHYKDFIFKKNNLKLLDFFELVNFLKKFNKKIIITSDIGDYPYHNSFLSKYPFINFSNGISNSDQTSSVCYCHNISGSDLFKLITQSHVVISPHGALTVMGAYLNKNIIDIFDQNVNLNSFREFKPSTKAKYNFLILRSDLNKNLLKFDKILKSYLS